MRRPLILPPSSPPGLITVMVNHNGKQRAEGNDSEEFDKEEQSYEEWAFQRIDTYYDAHIEEEKECLWLLL